MDAKGIEAKEVVPASRKLGRDEAEAMAKQASKVVVMKGKKVSEFNAGPKTTDECVDAMLGPTGNLRAPTLRFGKLVLVGFNEEVYEKHLG